MSRMPVNSHFAVVCLLAKPLNRSEANGDCYDTKIEAFQM